MSMQVTLTLPDEVYDRVRRMAHGTGRDLHGVLADTLVTWMALIGPDPSGETRVSELSDQEVLALCESRMESAQERQMGALLDRQQAGKLNEKEHTDLTALMRAYQEGQLRKALALAEAVRRGLRDAVRTSNRRGAAVEQSNRGHGPAGMGCRWLASAKACLSRYPIANGVCCRWQAGSG